FSPCRSDQEKRVAEIIREESTTVYITLSHEIAGLGLSERENASILDACLRPLAKQTIEELQEALPGDVPCFLTRNICGSTNSMIGAAHLSGIKNGIVIDIGVIVNGRPRQTQTVIMSFSSSVLNTPVTDTVSLPLGGGTIIHVNEKEHTVQVEPDSVAYRFDQEALAFGGKTMTGTDIAFAAGLATGIGHCSVKLSSFIVEQVLDYVKELVTRNIERMKTNIEPVPVVLCGGGPILIDIDQSFPDVTQMVRIDHFAVCNAVGAVLCLISASMDLIFDLLPSPVDGDQQRKHVIDQLIVDVCQPPIYIDLTKKRPTFDGNGVWCIDSIVLGSGGGGKYKMRVVPTSYFAASSDLIVGAGFMGALTVSHELLPNGHGCLEAVNVLEKYLSTNIAGRGVSRGAHRRRL
ncbi:unnamed protein product, partial [Rotaria magnacalcarata]